jgi:serine/threonine protein kinase
MDFSEKLFKDELNCLARAKHNNIARFLGYCWDTQGELAEYGGNYVMAQLRQRFLCFEYVPNGNLHDYIEGISFLLYFPLCTFYKRKYHISIWIILS